MKCPKCGGFYPLDSSHWIFEIITDMNPEEMSPEERVVQPSPVSASAGDQSEATPAAGDHLTPEEARLLYHFSRAFKMTPEEESAFAKLRRLAEQK